MIGAKKPVSIEDQVYRKILSSRKKKARRKSPNMTEKIITIVISLIILLFAFGCAYYYNVFINLQYNIEADLAQIDTQLQKRKNLIINLGITVVEYSKHERQIFTHLGELRAAVNGGGDSQALLDELRSELEGDEVLSAILSENMDKWENALSGLLAIAEQYPDLKLSENFRTFMAAILDFEEMIADLRMTYNNSVNEYSTITDQFPGFIFASIFRCQEFSFFQVDDSSRKFIRIDNDPGGQRVPAATGGEIE
ncbi:MAG: LemA family protein [Candidatus Glassbacteria bacterium]|nr:LemA family protein [Candidatus Glassbacteria bacterium]